MMGISCLSLCMAVCNVLLTCVLLYPVVSFIIDDARGFSENSKL